MFYACLAILLLFMVMFCCVTLAIIDLELYNFGLYIVLLCIVGSYPGNVSDSTGWNFKSKDDRFTSKDECACTEYGHSKWGRRDKADSPVWKGMAWVTDGIEEDDEDISRTYDKIDQSQGVSDDTSGSAVIKRLSTIAESSSFILREMDEVSSEINSKNDVTL